MLLRMRRPEYLPLPGISTRDPNFYEGADYEDRARFAQPVNDKTVEHGVIEIGIERNPTSPGLDGEQTPSLDFPEMGEQIVPFKFGGR